MLACHNIVVVGAFFFPLLSSSIKARNGCYLRFEEERSVMPRPASEHCVESKAK